MPNSGVISGTRPPPPPWRLTPSAASAPVQRHGERRHHCRRCICLHQLWSSGVHIHRRCCSTDAYSSVTGGPVASWSISPALPAGLTFSATDGHIGGTATAASAATVLRDNRRQLRRSVERHADDRSGLECVGRAWSRRRPRARCDSAVHVSSAWTVAGIGFCGITAAAAILASGDTGCISGGAISNDCGRGPLVDVAGPTAVIRTLSGFEVYSSSSGQLLSDDHGNCSLVEAGKRWELHQRGQWQLHHTGQSNGLDRVVAVRTAAVVSAG